MKNLEKGAVSTDADPKVLLMEQFLLDGHSLSLQKVFDFLGNSVSFELQISGKSRKKVAKAREQLEQWITADKKVIYGITTGLGKLKDYVVSEEEQAVFQRNILYSHAVGLGHCFHPDIAKLAMLFRANVFCRGHSGVRPGLIDRLLLYINKGIYPQLPQIGSLGVGDLQPMAHLGLCITGDREGQAWYKGKVGNITDILEKAGVAPVEFPLAAREALALMSGSTVLLAAAVHCYFQAVKLIAAADAAAALNLEAVRGETNAFDLRIHEARGVKTQIVSAQNIQRLIEGSRWMTEEGRKRLSEMQPRVQDSVSLRSTCQVHGAVRDVLEYIGSVLQQEMNASTDNPLLFEGQESYESLSGGNFHGALLAYCMDFLSIVLTDLAVLSERRSARLLDPVMSYGLPCNLVGGCAGLNTGFALVQADATALVGEMRILATPASIGSIPSKGNQEDHNSMGMGAVRKAVHIIEHLKKVLAIEILCAAQAVDLISPQMEGLSLGKGTQEIHQLVRRKAPPMKEDRYIRKDLLAVLELVEGDDIINCTYIDRK